MLPLVKITIPLVGPEPAHNERTPCRPATKLANWFCPAKIAAGHPTTVPSLFNARFPKVEADALIPTPFVKSGGTFVSPRELSPHATTVPSERKARLCVVPAAIAVTLLSH